MSVLIGRVVGKSDISRSKRKGKIERHGISHVKGGGATSHGEDDEWITPLTLFGFFLFVWLCDAVKCIIINDYIIIRNVFLWIMIIEKDPEYAQKNL